MSLTKKLPRSWFDEISVKSMENVHEVAEFNNCKKKKKNEKKSCWLNDRGFESCIFRLYFFFNFRGLLSKKLISNSVITILSYKNAQTSWARKRSWDENKFWLTGLLEYKQFWNGYFSKLFFEVVAFTQLTKMKWKK